MSEAISQAKAAIEREDYEMASGLLRPLAEAGQTEAQFLLGYLFFTGAEVTKPDSRRWLQKAAVRDHPAALYHLACLGDNFDFGPPENDAARVCLIRAAELGHADAQRDLGCFYATGDGGLPRDETSARYWYGQAAAQGHAEAQYDYGGMVLNGEGGPADPEAGMGFLRRSAAQGDAAAIHYLTELARYTG